MTEQQYEHIKTCFVVITILIGMNMLLTLAVLGKVLK